MDTFSEMQFHDDKAARAYLERLRWPDGPVCPHCGVVDHAYPIKPEGTYRCAEAKCRGNFTVTMNTPMERSHIALHKWVQAFALMTASKKGISAHQLHRTLGITYRSAWFMAHRIRESMRTGGLAPLGGGGMIVEADETYFGPVDVPKPRSRGRIPKPTKGGRSGPADKRAIVALVERGGNVRTFHVPIADKVSVSKIVADNIAKESRLHTDESNLYPTIGKTFEGHSTVKHSAGEYVRSLTPRPPFRYKPSSIRSLRTPAGDSGWQERKRFPRAWPHQRAPGRLRRIRPSGTTTGTARQLAGLNGQARCG